jgi:hypothetical protein
VAGVRPAWLAALALAIAAAFDPLTYLLLFPLLVVALIAAIARLSWVGVRRALVLLAVPPALLMPWSARLLHHPALAVLGIGQSRAGLQAPRLHPIDILLLHPGGPGMPPTWLDAVVVVAALAGLLQLTRPGPAWFGWLLALDGLIVGVLVARANLRVPGAAASLPGWPGMATALIGAGLLMSVAVAGARLRARLAQTDFGWRQPVAVVLAGAAALTPLAAAAVWVAHGTGRLLRSNSSALLPPFVAAESSAHDQARTVALQPVAGGGVSYTMLRDREAQLGDADLPPDPRQVQVVDAAVADLAAGIGQTAATELAHAGIRYVLVPKSADADLGARIAAGGGVLPQNPTDNWRVWEVQATAGRLAIASVGNDDWQLPPDPVGVGKHAAPVKVPFAPGARQLVLAEAPSAAWQAIAGGGRRGTPLAATTVDGMQAFALPTTAVDVVVSRAPDRRADWLTFELVALAVVLLGAVPGGRRAAEQQRPGRLGEPDAVEPPPTDDGSNTAEPRRVRA